MPEPGYAVVTGASRGLGSVFARALAARGKNLVLIARSQARLEALATELETSHSIRAIPLPLDLTSPPAGQCLVQQLASWEVEVDLLVNNAGFGLRGEFRALPLERQMEMIRLNAAAVVDLTFRLLPALQKHRGSIINAASAAGFQPIPYAAVYAATKSFLLSFSLGLEQELRAQGVKVVTLCPGRIRFDSSEAGEGDRRRTFPGLFQPPGDVVRAALSTLDRKGGLVVPGVLNKVSVFTQRVIPRRLSLKIVASLARMSL